jgi:bifunctional DNase/RNase
MTDVPTEPVEDSVVGAAGDEPVVPPESWCIVAVAEVSMELPDTYPEVVLHEAQHPWRELRIPVGLSEGSAIAYALRGIDTPRPLTHTLVAEILERHGVSIEAVRITVRRGQSFFAEIDTNGPHGHHVVPCRPSDALALALRQRLPTPILAAEWVFDPRDETQDRE